MSNATSGGGDFSSAYALSLADRAQAVCEAQHGAGNRCCLMREVADALRAFASDQIPIFTVTGTIVDMGELDKGRGLVIGKSSKAVTVLGLSKDELIAMRLAFAEEVTLTVRLKKC